MNQEGQSLESPLRKKREEWRTHLYREGQN
jgi:hypothetical protein